jgi:hypothetical protein
LETVPADERDRLQAMLTLGDVACLRVGLSRNDTVSAFILREAGAGERFHVHGPIARRDLPELHAAAVKAWAVGIASWPPIARLGIADKELLIDCCQPTDRVVGYAVFDGRMEELFWLWLGPES